MRVEADSAVTLSRLKSRARRTLFFKVDDGRTTRIERFDLKSLMKVMNFWRTLEDEVLTSPLVKQILLQEPIEVLRAMSDHVI